MNFKDFTDSLLEIIRAELDDSLRIELHTTLKNNGVKLTGLTISEKNVNVSPTIYLEKFYKCFKAGTPIDEIAEKVICCYRESRMNNDIDISFFSDYDKVRDSLYIRLINRKLNEEILENVPYREYMDLAVITYLRLGIQQFENASIIITNNHLDIWGIDKEHLLDDAINNTLYKMEREIIPMSSFIEKIAADLPQDILDCRTYDMECMPMYVITNKEKHYGAAFILYPEILEEICNLLDGDIIILPSSVHEFIVIPGENENYEYCNSMVKSVNEENLQQEEILADHAYFYQRGRGFLI